MEGANPLLLALFLGAMSLIPFLLIVCTAFLKIAM
ncbi:EscR/YscR/HrcR family type III secretion system export apparatus protein, partial [Pseudomonas syringae pv. actinidiae]|nr:EscR/YscR/HrcR family type III secretion system export apparatus protein [Pseudomonas syringae pv. actinidiae]